MKEILIVEDDIILSKGIIMALKPERYSFKQAFTLKEARKYLSENVFELMLLDINLPDGNGVDFLQEIHGQYNTPIIMLTANDIEINIVTALDMGAIDYITKPFSLMVLRARVDVALRDKEAKSSIIIDDFDFNFQIMVFKKNGVAIELSKNEQKLLRILIENKGITLNRFDLIDKIWADGAEYVDENALSVTINRLRNKLEYDPKNPIYIKTKQFD